MILEVSIKGFLRKLLRFFQKKVENYLIYYFTSANAFLIFVEFIWIRLSLLELINSKGLVQLLPRLYSGWGFLGSQCIVLAIFQHSS